MIQFAKVRSLGTLEMFMKMGDGIHHIYIFNCPRHHPNNHTICPAPFVRTIEIDGCHNTWIHGMY